MEILIKLLIVFGLGAVELWAAIPAGLALRLHPLVTGITAATGAIAGVLFVLMLGKPIRAWLVSRHSGEGERQHKRIYRIWAKYGAIGLGLSAPLLVGAPLGTALGLTLGMPSDRLLLWMGLGIILWSTGLTLAGIIGLVGIEALRH